MEIRILYFPGCPSYRKAADRLRAALGESGRADVAVVFEDVSTWNALRPEWRGSPTILIDGVDRFARDGESDMAEGTVPGLDACRVYVTAAGLEGSPSVEQLRMAMSMTSRNQEAQE